MAPVNDPLTNLGAAGVFLGATGFLVALVGAGVFVLTGPECWQLESVLGSEYSPHLALGSEWTLSRTHKDRST